MSNLKAIKAWCKFNGIKVKSVKHIHSRAYVIGRTSPQGIIVSVPWIDSEQQCQDFDKRYPMKVIYKFDDSLDSGMWCITAYINTKDCGYSIAIPLIA